MGLADLWERQQEAELGWGMGGAIGAMIFGGFFIICGLVAWDSWFMFTGAVMMAAGFIGYLLYSTIFSEMEVKKEILEPEGVSASTIFGARVFDNPDVPCPSCKGTLFDIHSDGSGKCSKCKMIFGNVRMTASAKCLGTRNKDGTIRD